MTVYIDTNSSAKEPRYFSECMICKKELGPFINYKQALDAYKCDDCKKSDPQQNFPSSILQVNR
jgi:DNA-directed RNA polymerase subunit RPC12/RpoP